MKIALTGAGGTGKTTLAKYISEKWGLPYAGSVSREVFAELGIANELAQQNMTKADILKLQWAIYERRKQNLEKMPAFVTDRLALDNYVYALRRCGEALDEPTRRRWEEGMVEDLYAADLVLYCPVGLFETSDDGMRQTDVAHQRLIDAAIYGMLCKHAFDKMAAHVYIVNMADLDRRKKYIDAFISELTALES
mgnify:CR=1 FL=1